MSHSVQRGPSGVVWVAEERDRAWVADAANVARWRLAAQRLTAVQREVLCRSYGLGCEAEPDERIQEDLGLSAEEFSRAEAIALRTVFAVFGFIEETPGVPSEELRDRHDTRPMELPNAIVKEWCGGCLICDREAVDKPLADSDGRVRLPLCAAHRRWAMASRRERTGKQARQLRRLLLAWSEAHGEDLEAARAWLGF